MTSTDEKPIILPQRPGLFIEFASVEIRSERLLLKPVTSKYSEEVFKEFNSTITRYMYPKPASHIEETRKILSEFTDKAKNGSDLVLVILHGESQEFLGICGLHGKLGNVSADFGIWVKESAHGKGYGREAIHALYGWACENLALECFYYPVDRRNIPSVKIPESLGGVIVEEKQSATMWGGTLEEVVYKIPSR